MKNQQILKRTKARRAKLCAIQATSIEVLESFFKGRTISRLTRIEDKKGSRYILKNVPVLKIEELDDLFYIHFSKAYLEHNIAPDYIKLIPNEWVIINENKTIEVLTNKKFFKYFYFKQQKQKEIMTTNTIVSNKESQEQFVKKILQQKKQDILKIREHKLFPNGDIFIGTMPVNKTGLRKEQKRISKVDVLIDKQSGLIKIKNKETGETNIAPDFVFDL